jgi:hypothetical protein
MLVHIAMTLSTVHGWSLLPVDDKASSVSSHESAITGGVDGARDRRQLAPAGCFSCDESCDGSCDHACDHDVFGGGCDSDCDSDCDASCDALESSCDSGCDEHCDGFLGVGLCDESCDGSCDSSCQPPPPPPSPRQPPPAPPWWHKPPPSPAPPPPHAPPPPSPPLCGQTLTGSTSGSSNQIGNPAPDHIYDFCTSARGAYTFDSCGSGFDTYIRVWTQDLSRELFGCDDCGDCGTQTILTGELNVGCYNHQETMLPSTIHRNRVQETCAWRLARSIV